MGSSDQPEKSATDPATVPTELSAATKPKQLTPEELVEELARDMVLRGSSGQLDRDAAHGVMARAVAAAAAQRDPLAPATEQVTADMMVRTPAPTEPLTPEMLVRTGENAVPAVARPVSGPYELTPEMQIDPVTPDMMMRASAEHAVPAIARTISGPLDLTPDMKIDHVTPDMLVRTGENPVPAVARPISGPYELTPEMQVDPVTPDMLLRASAEHAVPAIARTVSGSHMVTPEMLIASIAAPPPTPMEPVAQVDDELVPGVTTKPDLVTRAKRLSQQLQAQLPPPELDLRPPTAPRTMTPMMPHAPAGPDVTLIIVIATVVIALVASIILLAVAW